MSSHKGIIMLSLFCFFFLELSAQVGIGTTAPDTSSALDIYSTDLGVLLPRVDLTSTSNALPITSPVTSLLVYNENTSNDVTPGFYFWKDSQWNRLNDDINKVYGEIYNNPSIARGSRQTMDPNEPIWFNIEGVGVIQGVTSVPIVPPPFKGFEIITSGIYRVTYAISIEMWVASGTPDPDPDSFSFYLSTGLTTADIIPGSFSDTQVTHEDTRPGNSNCSMDKIIHLNAGDVIRLFTDKLSTIVYVIPNSATMNIELIQAD